MPKSSPMPSWLCQKPFSSFPWVQYLTSSHTARISSCRRLLMPHCQLCSKDQTGAQMLNSCTTAIQAGGTMRDMTTFYKPSSLCSRPTFLPAVTSQQISQGTAIHFPLQMSSQTSFSEPPAPYTYDYIWSKSLNQELIWRSQSFPQLHCPLPPIVSTRSYGRGYFHLTIISEARIKHWLLQTSSWLVISNH